MAKQSWPGQREAVRIGATLALLLVASRAVADGAPVIPEALVAPEQVARQKEAMALHDEARELHAHGRYRAAIAKLEAALALDPQGKELVYNLALIHERLGEVDPAERYYRRYLEEVTDTGEREKIEGVLRRLAGAKQDLVVAREATPPASPSRATAAPAGVEPARSFGPWVMVTGAVGAMGLFTGVILGVSALARSPGASAMTGPGVTANDLLADAKAAHRQAVGADISLLIGLVATGTAVGLHFASRPAPAPKPSTPRVDLALGPLAGAIRVSF